MVVMARKVLLVFLASLCYVQIISQRFYKIIPNTETCKVLDHTYVHNYTCKSKNVNRTLNLGSKEIFYQPGVVLTNLHGRRYEFNVPMQHTLLPEIFPSGEYRVDSKSYTIVNGETKYFALTQSYGEVKYTTAEQWRK